MGIHFLTHDSHRAVLFSTIFKELQSALINTEPFHVGEWQSQKLDDNPMLTMREVMNVSFTYAVPQHEKDLARETGAHLPWAEDHFKERVSGEPLNPPPSNEWWPFAQKNNAAHKSEGSGVKFSHTYPERMWPKNAGPLLELEPMEGIRFRYGDLNDVVSLLVKQPNTRQAYLPIWFPEDTGVVHGARVPCTLGYHFLIRNKEVQITYYMRSCDLVRHFQDDVYMAGRLLQWVVNEVNYARYSDAMANGPDTTAEYLRPGNLIMHIANLHVFNGDIAMMEYRDRKGQAWSE